MLELADLERSAASGDPQLADQLVAYLEQDDPSPGRPELSPDRWDNDDEESGAHYPEPPDAAFDLDALRRAVAPDVLVKKTPGERKQARGEAFAQAIASPFTPPRLRLNALILALYDRGDAYARGVLLDVFARGRMKWGIWQAAKQIYKRAEAEHDVAMWGVLAFRFDVLAATSYDAREIKPGTLIYLRRRAWRALRRIGTALPAAYPAWAVEVLRHYPASLRNTQAWVAPHIFMHEHLRGARGAATFQFPPWGDAMAVRAFPEAWKLAPAPLLRLLDSAQHDMVCEFAIACLRADHPLALRAVEPAWLARLGRRGIAAIDRFVVGLMKESPELHQSKLRALGLHDTALAFLRSASPEARAFAIEYAQAHAPDLAVDVLVALVEQGDAIADSAKFAAARLEAMTPAQLGLANLVRLVGSALAPWAADKLAQGFDPRTIEPALFVDAAAADGDGAFQKLIGVFAKRDVAVPAALWQALLDDPRFEDSTWRTRRVIDQALRELGKRSAAELGVAWIQRSLEVRARQDAVARWLDDGMLTGKDLDLEWLKRLVGRPNLRAIALKLLGDRRRVQPAAIGLPWLLELARAPEADAAQFAQRMLLESFEPADFGDGDAARGLARLWELAAGAKQKEVVRQFAATYLKVHHPELGLRQPEARTLGIKPRLASDAYALATVRPLLDDDRLDVRRLAIAIAGEEIARWGVPDVVYALAAAAYPEPRRLGAELLLSVLATDGSAPRIPAAWVDGARVFQLAEGAHKATREVALTLIRRMYERIGGAERLAWLMESPERDVRLFAVRLFWDRHRPKPWPADYVPRKSVGAPLGRERFDDLAALRQFARVVLFGLPPGRVGERDPIVEGGPKPERALPASVAKRRLIEAMRDVALDDVGLARAIAPVLDEFTHSTAKGEWHASVTALVQLRAKHGALDEAR